jgi:hypothetical protein
MTQILLYTTSGCHLCELAQAMLSQLAQLNELVWRPVEISDDEALVNQYGIRIPVVCVEGAGQDLGWPFDEAQLLAYLSVNLPA